MTTGAPVGEYTGAVEGGMGVSDGEVTGADVGKNTGGGMGAGRSGGLLDDGFDGGRWCSAWGETHDAGAANTGTACGWAAE